MGPSFKHPLPHDSAYPTGRARPSTWETAWRWARPRFGGEQLRHEGAMAKGQHLAREPGVFLFFFPQYIYTV